MKSQALFNPVVLVDIAITNARNAGFEPDQQQIAFFWKIARGDVDASEIEETVQSASRSLKSKNAQQYGHLSCEDVDIDALKKKLSELIDNLSLKVVSLRRGPPCEFLAMP
ncbi:hypothetical protein G6L37_32315 [Agrobacterium rubi]|uniref:hypothetical protein n=1 Tax=Agrobacterium rubi TaxID=28099 RepID=UPI001572F546|nr:hypothetical protein [Agrobacterium rubi]NTF10683.1 hypothetical protein [Agrobacterium rubi]NTF23077.1 hypothetical protein [Agrobacterium rubi]NTF30008.1 hypothetical protein [Agrobacterium rubi]